VRVNEVGTAALKCLRTWWKDCWEVRQWSSQMVSWRVAGKCWPTRRAIYQNNSIDQLSQTAATGCLTKSGSTGWSQPGDWLWTTMDTPSVTETCTTTARLCHTFKLTTCSTSEIEFGIDQHRETHTSNQCGKCRSAKLSIECVSADKWSDNDHKPIAELRNQAQKDSISTKYRFYIVRQVRTRTAKDWDVNRT